MNKKEEFKNFAKLHPELIGFIKDGKNSWQDFYEIYDIYGQDETAWNSYFKNDPPKKEVISKAPNINKKEESKTSTSNTLNDITNLFKKADLNSIQKHIGTAQKAIGLFQELTTKSTAAGIGAGALAGLAAKPTSQRPLNKFFED